MFVAAAFQRIMRWVLASATITASRILSKSLPKPISSGRNRSPIITSDPVPEYSLTKHVQPPQAKPAIHTRKRSHHRLSRGAQRMRFPTPTDRLPATAAYQSARHGAPSGPRRALAPSCEGGQDQVGVGQGEGEGDEGEGGQRALEQQARGNGEEGCGADGQQGRGVAEV